MPRSSHSCNDCRYSYLIIGICIPSVDSPKILFGALSEACSAIVTTLLRPGLTLVVQQISQTAIEPSGRAEIISTSTTVVEQTMNVMQQNLFRKAWSPYSRNNRITCYDHVLKVLGTYHFFCVWGEMNFEGGNRKKTNLIKGGIKFGRNMVRGERNYEFVQGGRGDTFLIIRMYNKVLNGQSKTMFTGFAIRTTSCQTTVSVIYFFRMFQILCCWSISSFLVVFTVFL